MKAGTCCFGFAMSQEPPVRFFVALSSNSASSFPRLGEFRSQFATIHCFGIVRSRLTTSTSRPHRRTLTHSSAMSLVRTKRLWVSGFHSRGGLRNQTCRRRRSFCGRVRAVSPADHDLPSKRIRRLSVHMAVARRYCALDTVRILPMTIFDPPVQFLLWRFIHVFTFLQRHLQTTLSNALQRTRSSRCGCDPCLPRAGSL